MWIIHHFNRTIAKKLRSRSLYIAARRQQHSAACHMSNIYRLNQQGALLTCIMMQSLTDVLRAHIQLRRLGMHR